MKAGGLLVCLFRKTTLSLPKKHDCVEEFMKTTVDSCLFEESKLLSVWYLGHSSYAVETKEALLIFDYVETNLNLIGLKDSAVLNLLDYEDKKIYVFITHEHEDHFDKTVFKWGNSINNIVFILGWEGAKSERCINLSENKSMEINGLCINTIKSTDEGVGFLVKIDGKTILHLGDHANWHEELTRSYQEQINEIAKVSTSIDIVFTPIAKGSGSRPKCIMDGVIYMIERLDPSVVFPMHANSREYLYKEFFNEIALERNSFASRIKYAENIGQKWTLHLVDKV